MITRKERMTKTATHNEYYADILKAAHIGNRFSAEFIALCKAEMDGGNEHLNESAAVARHTKNQISLQSWDSHGARLNSATLAAAMRARGDYPTVAGLCCLAKELMRQQIGGK